MMGLDSPVRSRILDALDRLAIEPSMGDVKKLKDRPEFRLRVGDWRILFTRDDSAKILHILRVLPRGKAYQ